MRILHITDSLPPAVLGGSGRIVWDTAVAQAKSGNDVTVLTCAKPGTFPETKDGVRILTIEPKTQRWAHYRSVFSNKRAKEVMRHIKNVKPEIIHAHLIAWQAGYKWILKARKKFRIVVTCHDVMNTAYGRVTPDETGMWLRDLKRFRWSWNPFRNLLIRRLFNDHCTVITVSDALKAYMKRMGFKNLTTVHNGVDAAFWKPESQEVARTHFNLPHDKTIFLLAGRMGVDKGSDAIIRILPENAHLALAGETDPTVMTALNGRVTFLGKLNEDEMRRAYAAVDAVLIPSRCLDCFPTVALEAMSCERAVVATSWGGAKEAVVDEKTGWIIDPLDEAAWSNRLAWCVAHRSELLTYGKAGRTRLEEHFSQKHMLEKLGNTYERARS